MSKLAEREVEFAARIRASHGRDDLWAYLAGTIPDDDDLLASLIAVEGRCRHELGLRASLGKYLKVIPGLVDRAVVLDAAIESAFRTAPDGSRPVSEETVEALTKKYPQIKDAILEAASLDRLMMSTDTIRRGAETPAIEEELPCGFGELLPSGKARYILLERIGVGAHGEVYKSIDRKLSDGDNRALVALKVMRPAPDTWQRRRFADEATKARRINHPNVVRVIDRGEVDLRDYIVFEYIEGGTLEQLVTKRSKRIAVRTAVELVEGIAKGVQAAHAAGLVHCDIKPANILVNPKGLPKITDFGIASKLGSNADHAPTIGEATLAGNLAFMAPERFRMRREGVAIASIPSDVYAIGGILYWLLTGQLPGGSSVAELTARFGGQGPAPSAPSPADIVHDLDPDLNAICQRALAPDANERHPAAGSLAEDLHAWLAHEPISWAKPSASRRFHLLRTRRPIATWAALVAIVSVVALSAGLFWQQRAQLRRQQQDAIERARTDAVAQYRASAEESINQLRQSFNRARQQGMGDQSLLELDLAEHIFGTGLLDNPSALAQLWDTRITIYTETLERLERQGDGDSIHAALLEQLLGIWLLRASRYDDALAALSSSRASFRTVNPDDPIVAQLDALVAIANVLMPAQSQAPLQDFQAWERAINLDLRAQARQQRSNRHRALYLQALEKLYSPQYLDRPTSLGDIQIQLQTLRTNQNPSTN